MPDADPSRIAADQSAQLPQKRAEDKAWAGVTVPDEARRVGIERLKSEIVGRYAGHSDHIVAHSGEIALTCIPAALAAAAPLIVAANEPEPAHEVQCQECGATIRARMADQPDGALRATLTAALARSRCTRPEPCDDCLTAAQDSAEDALPAIASHVAAQVSAARAEALALHVDPGTGFCQVCCDWKFVPEDPDASYVEWPCPTARALGVESSDA